MIPLLTVVVGALGSLARYRDSAAPARAVGRAFPWRTRVVDVAGSGVIGVAAAGPIGDARRTASPLARPVAVTGACRGGAAVRLPTASRARRPSARRASWT